MRLLPIVSVALLTCLSHQSAFAGDTWQASQSPHFALGVRNKYGSHHYTVGFQVKAPNRKIYLVAKDGDGDDFVYVTFPDDFKALSMPFGRYTWSAVVDGNVVASGEFTYNGKWR